MIYSGSVKREDELPKRVAIFDYDHTLITGDSFLPFLSYVAGRIQTYAALGEGLARCGLTRARGQVTEGWRTPLKSHLLMRLIAGKRVEDMQEAAVKTRLWQTKNVPIMKALHEHHEKGDRIVIASGGLDLYLSELLRGVPYHALICTDIGVKDGIITGEMINGNCVRARKAERVGAWLDANGPFEESWGYGNYPHDVPMMELVRHRIIVS